MKNIIHIIKRFCIAINECFESQEKSLDMQTKELLLKIEKKIRKSKNTNNANILFTQFHNFGHHRSKINIRQV